MSSPFLISRSALAEYQRCPRKYYWQQAYKGVGVVPRKQALPLLFGSCTHLGLQSLLENGDIDEALRLADHEFTVQTRAKGLDLQASEDTMFVYNEQRALLEALLRAWFLVRYPSFTAEYEVLDIEREELWTPRAGIGFMARADGLLRSRSDESLYILSFKTAKQWSAKTDQEARSDIQGISELVAVEARLGERVQGIQMEYLIKGRRDEYPKSSGIYRTYSPLVHPWFNAGTGKYAWSWDWQDLEGKHTLGNKWRTVNIWEREGVREWLSLLTSGTVQPEAGNCLSEYVISPLPYFRNRDEVESWKIQAHRQAQRIDADVRSVEEARSYTGPFDAGVDPQAQFGVALDIKFPQHRHSCNYPTQCPYKSICFGSAGPEPEEDPRYEWREPHHQLEQERYELLHGQ